MYYVYKFYNAKIHQPIRVHLLIAPEQRSCRFNTPCAREEATCLQRDVRREPRFPRGARRRVTRVQVHRFAWSTNGIVGRKRKGGNGKKNESKRNKGKLAGVYVHTRVATPAREAQRDAERYREMQRGREGRRGLRVRDNVTQVAYNVGTGGVARGIIRQRVGCIRSPKGAEAR